MHHRRGSNVRGHFRNGSWVSPHLRGAAWVSDYQHSSFSNSLCKPSYPVYITRYNEEDKNQNYDCFGFDDYNYHMNTRVAYDNNGFDAYGIHIKTETCFDENGFNRFGIHFSDITPEEDYDLCGYDKDGYDKYGFDKRGFHKISKTRIYDKQSKRLIYHELYKSQMTLINSRADNIQRFNDLQLSVKKLNEDTQQSENPSINIENIAEENNVRTIETISTGKILLDNCSVKLKALGWKVSIPETIDNIELVGRKGEKIFFISSIDKGFSPMQKINYISNIKNDLMMDFAFVFSNQQVCSLDIGVMKKKGLVFIRDCNEIINIIN